MALLAGAGDRDDLLVRAAGVDRAQRVHGAVGHCSRRQRLSVPRDRRDQRARRHSSGRDCRDHALDGHVRELPGGRVRGRLHEGRSRLRAVLRRDFAVRVLDVHAGAGGEFPVDVRVLGGGGAVQLSADRLLVPPAERGRGGEEGVRRQPDRRLRFRAGDLPDLDDVRLARFQGRAGRPGPLGGAADGDRHDDLPAVVPGGDGQKRPVPADGLAPGCDGRPHAGERPDSRGDDGHRGRLFAGPGDAAVHARARRADGRRRRSGRRPR